MVVYYLMVKPELESRISELQCDTFFNLPVTFELERPIDFWSPRFWSIPHVVPTTNVFYFH